jgi:pSer/pThr/pTyr-binding forkhead associated (FHA) protein
MRLQVAGVSRLHASIESCRNGFRIVDLDSSNGVFVNETRVSSALLHDGDMIQLGSVVLRYCRGS